MPMEQLQKLIEEDLYEDAYKRQLADPKTYGKKNLAKGFENLLFRCPYCGGMDCFHTEGDTILCGSCGWKIRYDVYGKLSGSPFETVKALSDWQKQQVQRDIQAGMAYTAPAASLFTVKKHEESFAAKGSVTMTPELLRCGDMEFPMADIADLSMHGQRAIVFTVKGQYYELLPETGSNVLKFMLYYHGCKTRAKEKVG